MAKYYCSKKKCTSNIKRKIPVKILEERGIAIHFRLFFQAKIAKLEKFHLNFASLELEFLWLV